MGCETNRMFEVALSNCEQRSYVFKARKLTTLCGRKNLVQMKHYNLVANRTVTPESLGQALQHLTTHACWENIQTRSGALRKYDQWCFEDCDVPKRFDEIRPLILALLGEARNAEANVGEIHPIQCFLCLYED
eukprot:gene31015-38896_t